MEITQKIVALKLPEKYRFTGGVMGNGKALCLTNGTRHGALGIESTFLWQGFRNQEGADIGTALTGSGELTPGVAMGISTDPEKSGITLEKEPWMVFIAY